MPAADGRSLSEDLVLMRAAALEAGALAMRFRRPEGVKTWDKTPGHPVTEADLAVNEFLGDKLQKARPSYGWLSEETADDASARRQSRVWVVDPIDGTRAYMRPNDPNWCIALSLVEEGEPVASMVYAPMHRELYEARRGGGAFCNGRPLRAGDAPALEGHRMIASADMIKHPAWPTPWPPVELAKPKPNATLYRMALVASGRFQSTLALFRKSDWDLAAGALLITEAGGLATTHLGEPFRFNRPVTAQRSLLASGKQLHPLLMARVRSVDLPDPNADG